MQADYTPAWTQKPKVGQGASLWDQFDTSVHPKAEQVKKMVAHWLKDGVPAGKSLLIEGNCGTGKTLLAKAIAQAYPYIKRESSDDTFEGSLGAKFVSEVSLVERIKAIWDGYTDQSQFGLLNELLWPEILIFDDLGAYQTRDDLWLRNIYAKVFDGRCEAGKPCLFTSNMGMFIDAGFGSLQPRIGRRNWDRLYSAIKVTDTGFEIGQTEELFYFEMFDVPSARSNKIFTRVNAMDVGGDE